MKYARIGKNRILVEVPTDYAEGLKMLTAAMNGYYNKRGGILPANQRPRASLTDFSARAPWPPIRPSHSSICCKKSAAAKAPASMRWKSPASGALPRKRRSKRDCAQDHL